jgi:hypothetical protein
VCVGDVVRFSITIFNLTGLVKEIEWCPPVWTPTPNVTGLNYDKDRTKFMLFKHSSQKVYCDLNRVCMIED